MAGRECRRRARARSRGRSRGPAPRPLRCFRLAPGGTCRTTVRGSPAGRPGPLSSMTTREQSVVQRAPRSTCVSGRRVLRRRSPGGSTSICTTSAASTWTAGRSGGSANSTLWSRRRSVEALVGRSDAGHRWSASRGAASSRPDSKRVRSSTFEMRSDMSRACVSIDCASGGESPHPDRWPDRRVCCRRPR